MQKIGPTATLNSVSTLQIKIGEKIIGRALASRGKKKIAYEEEELATHLDQAKTRFIIGRDEDRNYLFLFEGTNGKIYIGIEDTNTVLPIDLVTIKKGT